MSVHEWWSRFGLLVIAVVLIVVAVAFLRGGLRPVERTHPEKPRRRRRRFPDPAEELGGLLVIVTGFLIYYRSYLWTHYRGLMIVGLSLLAAGVVALVWMIVWNGAGMRRWRLRALTRPLELPQLDARQFEQACADLFREQGYEVEVAQGQGHQVADLVLAAQGGRTVAHCLHLLGKRQCEEPDVQGLLTAMRAYEAERGYLVSTAELTASAVGKARLVEAVEVWSLQRLAEEAEAALAGGSKPQEATASPRTPTVL